MDRRERRRVRILDYARSVAVLVRAYRMDFAEDLRDEVVQVLDRELAKD